MGFRYYKRIHVSPWLSFNVSRSGVSTTFGPHGLHFTVGPRGTSESIGLPGSGLYYTERQSAPRGASGGLGLVLKVIAVALVLVVALLVGTLIGGR